MIKSLSEKWHVIALVSAAVVAAYSNHTAAPLAAPAGWVGVNTHVGKTDGYEALQATLQATGKAVRQGAKVVVLPEAIGGDWELNSLYWAGYENTLQKRGVTVLVGAEQRLDQRQRINALFSVGRHSGLSMHSRVPVPLGMWNPLSKTRHFVSDWAGKGVTVVGEQRVASLICYEQLMMWPVLVSAIQKPTVMVAASNAWWSTGTTIPGIQNATVESWSRLFRIPVITAVNI